MTARAEVPGSPEGAASASTWRGSRTGRRSFGAQTPAPLRRYLRTEVVSAALLVVATVVALAWASSPWSASYEALWSTEVAIDVGGRSLSMSLEHWVDDGLMALFFFVVGLEVRREFSVGEFTVPRRAVVPVAAAVGGVVVPAALYLLLAPSSATHGWGVVIGTDTAFMLGALAVVGPTFATQLRVLLLTLTVVDDIVAVGVIGVVYSDELDPLWLGVMAFFSVVMALLSRAGAWRGAPYVLAGLALWLASLGAGLHAAIGGMIGGLLVAARPPDPAAVERAARYFRAFRQSPDVGLGRTAHLGVVRAVSVNERLQAVMHPWTAYVVVPVFALANAGVDLSDGVLADALTSRLTWAVVVALVVGKLLGVGGTALLTARAGLGSLPAGVAPGHVVGGAALSGMGFTVSLLVAGLAFDDRLLEDEATVGVLVAAVVAVLLGKAVFQVTAVLHGHPDADLPRVLSRPVDPETDNVRGAPDAPLTLVEYGDFECPFCSQATGVVRELRQRFGDELRYVFRHLPLDDVHPRAELAARAAVAAGEQGAFWEMHDLLFAHQDELDVEDLAGYAARLGLDVERFLRDLESEQVAERVRADVASAEESGARGTPTFFVGGVRHTGPTDTETLAGALEASRTAPSA